MSEKPYLALSVAVWLVCVMLFFGQGNRASKAEAQAESYQAEVCTLAFSHAESPADTLAVLRTYDYCELEDDQ